MLTESLVEHLSRRIRQHCGDHSETYEFTLYHCKTTIVDNLRSVPETLGESLCPHHLLFVDRTTHIENIQYGPRDSCQYLHSCDHPTTQKSITVSGAPLTVRVPCETFTSALLLAVNGLGIALVPEPITRSFSDLPMYVHPIPKAHIFRSITLICRKTTLSRSSVAQIWSKIIESFATDSTIS